MTAAEPVVSNGRSGTAISPVLTCRQLRCGYGAATVVRSLDLEVRPGEIVALLGPNGAGKSTLLLTIAGLLPRLGGTVSVSGRETPRRRPAAAAKDGLVLVPDDRSLFPGLTVAETLEVARRKAGRPAREVLDLFPALESRWQVEAGNLSGGEQQMLAMARALIQAPKVLLIDELSMGLAPVIVEGLLAAVREVADGTGAAIVLVEQHVSLALQVADRGAVLVHGELIMSGPAAELARRRTDLEAAYLGAERQES